MELAELERRVTDLVSRHDLDTEPALRLLDLVSEIGEAAKEILKGNAYGKRALALGPAWSEELSDVFFSLICLASRTGVNLEDGLLRALAKYEQRLEERGEAGSGR